MYNERDIPHTQYEVCARERRSKTVVVKNISFLLISGMSAIFGCKLEDRSVEWAGRLTALV